MSSLKEKLRLAAESARAVAKNVVEGKPIYVDEKITAARMKICFGCTHFQPETTKCGACGCYLQAKTKLADVRCPENKWGQ